MLEIDWHPCANKSAGFAVSHVGGVTELGSAAIVPVKIARYAVGSLGINRCGRAERVRRTRAVR